MMLEQGGTAGGAPETAIPATLHELLLARLDHLPPRTKALAQLAALLGREFDQEVLRAISFLPEDELQRDVEQLEQAGLLFQQGWPPHLTYAFKHALVQDAAYQSLPRSTRKHYHTRIFHVLSERFPAMAEEQPELLANHATRAGLVEQEEALALAEAMQHPYAVAVTLSFCASIEYEVEEPEAALDMANRLIAVSAGNGFLSTLAIGYCVLGWASARLGDAEKGIPIIQQGLALIQAMGALVMYPTCLVCLLKAYLVSGRIDEGLAAVKEGLKVLEPLLACRAHPDLLWLQGEFQIQKGEREAARASFEQALTLARHSGAALHALRSATSLARLLSQSGEEQKARELLSEVLGGVSADASLRDSRAAQELLAGLPGRGPSPGTEPG